MSFVIKEQLLHAIAANNTYEVHRILSQNSIQLMAFLSENRELKEKLYTVAKQYPDGVITNMLDEFYDEYSSEEDKLDDLGYKIMQTIQANDVAEFRNLIFSKRETVTLMTDLIRRYGKDRYKLLHTACTLACEDIATFLILFYLNVDIDLRTDEGTALEIACRIGLPYMVDQLLLQKAKLVVDESSAPPVDWVLYQVIRNGRELAILQCLVKWLCENNHDYLIRWLPKILSEACSGPSCDMLLFCLKKAEDCKVPFRLEFNVQAACEGNRKENVALLIEHGAKINDYLASNYELLIAQALQKYTKTHGTEETDVESNVNASCDEVSVLWEQKNLQILLPSWLTQFGHCLTSVDISRNELTSLPIEVPWQLKSLIHFKAAHNKLKTLNVHENKLPDCQRLSVVDLSHNELEALPVQLFQLTSLATLLLNNNRLTMLEKEMFDDVSINRHRYSRRTGMDLSQSWQCFNLQILNLASNKLQELTSQLEACGKLVNLNLSRNCLKVITLWSCPLEILDVSYNGLTAVPYSLDDSRRMTLSHLNLEGNKLTQVTTSICVLEALTDLNLSDNQLTGLPCPEYWKCALLSSLNLAKNWLQNDRVSSQSMVDFPECFAKSLLELDLSENRLKFIPPSVCNLTNLTSLKLNGNTDIQYLPKELGKLLQCYDLNISGLKIINLPKSLLGTHVKSKEILAHLRAQLLSCRPIYGMKLFVTGTPRSGKTMLINSLVNRQQKSNSLFVNEGHSLRVIDWVLKADSVRRHVLRDSGDDYPDISFQVYDFRGQLNLSLTERVFYADSSLYIIVFNLDADDISSLREKLVDIKAHALSSMIIVVGTHYDQLSEKKRKDIKNLARNINSRFQTNAGYPIIACIHAISNFDREHIDSLKVDIYKHAFNVEYFGPPSQQTLFPNKIKFLGRQVPEKYELLRNWIKKEKDTRLENGSVPIMSHKEYESVIEKCPAADIVLADEISLITKFLIECGTFLHFGDVYHGLGSSYFLDPVWLSDCLTSFIDIDCLASGGVIKLASLDQWLRDNDKHLTVSEYTELLQQFEIALLISQENLLLMTKLPMNKPRICTPKSQARTLCRLFKTIFIPNGFWNRLIARFHVVMPILFSENIDNCMTNLRRKLSKNYLDLEQTSQRAFCTYKMYKLQNETYWQRGLHITFEGGTLCVEAAIGKSSVDGILVTLSCNSEVDFSILAFICDQIEAILNDWYPGLLTNRGAVERIVYCPECLLHSSCSFQELQKMHEYKLIDCVSEYYEGIKTVICEKKNVSIPWKILLPDFCLPDDNNVNIDWKQLKKGTILGKGAEGVVYKGEYNGMQVAIKCNEAISSLLSKWKNSDFENSDYQKGSISSFIQQSLLSSFRSIRQEITFIHNLRHPLIIGLKGACLNKLTSVYELAQHGNLCSFLSKCSRSVQLVTTGGKTMRTRTPLQRRFTYKILLHIAMALGFLHGRNIAYKDLKGANILVMNDSVEDPIVVKLSDYGLAQLVTLQGIRGDEGTIGYQAPEIILGQPYDTKVDVYAYAMVIYEMFTGSGPFASVQGPPLAINKQVCKGVRPTLPKNLVTKLPALETMMTRCWSASPTDRPIMSDIVLQLKDCSCVMLRSVHNVADIGSVTALCLPSLSQAADYQPLIQQGFLKFWTDNATTLEDEKKELFSDGKPSDNNKKALSNDKKSVNFFNKFNIKRDMFKIQAEPVRIKANGLVGSTCSRIMASVTHNQFVINAYQDKLIYVLLPNRIDGNLDSVGKSSIKIESVPLALLLYSVYDKLCYLLVSCKNGSLLIFGLNFDELLYPLSTGSDESAIQRIKEVQLGTGPASCMTVITLKKESADADTLQLQEVWIGCGTNVAIVNLANWQIVGNIAVENNVNALTSFSSRVWCALEQQTYIKEFDVSSRLVVCCLDCSSANLHSIISFSVDQTSNEASFANSEASKFASELEEKLLASSSAQLRRKISYGKLRNKRRQCSQEAKCGKIYVTSLYCTGDTLWIGKLNGDIAIVCVSENNTYQFSYGELLAVLRDKWRGCDEANYYVMAMYDDCKKVVTVLNGAREPLACAKLVVWEKWNLEDYSKFRSWSNDIK